MGWQERSSAASPPYPFPARAGQLDLTLAAAGFPRGRRDIARPPGPDATGRLIPAPPATGDPLRAHRLLLPFQE